MATAYQVPEQFTGKAVTVPSGLVFFLFVQIFFLQFRKTRLGSTIAVPYGLNIPVGHRVIFWNRWRGTLVSAVPTVLFSGKGKRLMRNLIWTMLCAGLLSLAAPAPSRADPINPGFDLFKTLSPGTSANIPGVGTVDFKGVRFDAVNNLGKTDTVVHRTGSLPSGGTGNIPIELVALHLVSTMPINLGGGVFADLHATINAGGIITGLPQPDPLTPSTGMLNVLTHVDTGPGMGGGDFSSFLNVVPDLIFTTPGGDPSNPKDVLNHFAFNNEGTLQAHSQWCHCAPPGYPSNPSFPSGMFFPTVMFMETGPNAVHSFTPSTDGGGGVPEPSSLVLLGLGALGLFGYSRRCVQQASKNGFSLAQIAAMI